MANSGSSTTVRTPPEGPISARENIGLGDGLGATFTTNGNFGYTSTAQGEFLNSLTGLEFNPWNASVTSRAGISSESVAVTTSLTVEYSGRTDNWGLVAGAAFAFAAVYQAVITGNTEPVRQLCPGGC